MLNNAIALAARGLRVLPCYSVSDGECSCGDAHLDDSSAGKHPRVKDWQRVATCNEEQLREWWKKWPDANPAVATGYRSGCFVVDFDPRNGGFENIAALLDVHGP